MTPKSSTANSSLVISDLNVHYGQSHILWDVTLEIPENDILAVVGRNGMGKTTLCETIMGIVPGSSGSVLINNTEVLGLTPYQIVDLGVGYVPQGRRIWPSLTVDEHLRLAARKSGPWTRERLYTTFPRLKERRLNGGNQLSGGEQQMLAIGRALLGNPRLLIMDEPTEGLAPVIVEQIEKLLLSLVKEEGISVFLVEQNLGVAMRVSEQLAVMVNGRIAAQLDTNQFAADKQMQQQLLGIADNAQVDDASDDAPTEHENVERKAQTDSVPMYDARALAGLGQKTNKFSFGNPLISQPPPAADFSADFHGVTKFITRWNDVISPMETRSAEKQSESDTALFHNGSNAAYVAGTFDTKRRELFFVANLLKQRGIKTITVDLSTSGQPSTAEIAPNEVAQSHPNGAEAVFTQDRGTAVAAMGKAFQNFLANKTNVGGIISLGGSGGTALATPAMQALPIGVPKVMVSTVASGDVSGYVGPSDICMLYSVTDISGLNHISEQIFSNATNALVGMMLAVQPQNENRKPSIGLTMFGVTTPCVQLLSSKLEDAFDCLIFHATGTGGRSMEKLVDSNRLVGILDITTTEVCDLVAGGVMSAGEDRFGAIIRSGIPYVGSCGALDMVNFGALESVPEKYKKRNLYVHNAHVTLMRTTIDENRKIGEWIGNKLSQCNGPIRFFIPEKGLSMLDSPGQPFYDPSANEALFDALNKTVNQTENRKLIRLPYHINDSAFADIVMTEFKTLMH